MNSFSTKNFFENTGNLLTLFFKSTNLRNTVHFLKTLDMDNKYRMKINNYDFSEKSLNEDRIIQLSRRVLLPVEAIASNNRMFMM